MVRIENTDTEFLYKDSGWATASNYSYCKDTSSFIKLDFTGNIEIYFQANSDCGYVKVYFDDEEEAVVVNAGGNGQSRLIYTKEFSDSHVHRVRICNNTSRVTAFDYFVVSGAPLPYGSFDTYVMYEIKYLIRNGAEIYTIENGAINSIGVVELTSGIFQAYGIDEIPTWETISSLTNPEVLCWFDDITDKPSLSATMSATPIVPMTFESKNYSMVDESILGVERAYVTASSDVVFAISVDDGVTWYMWTGQAWGILTDTATGMSAETINAITTEQWAELMTTGQFKVRMTLFDENSSFTSFVIDYIN